jgi:hypothetical protein
MKSWKKNITKDYKITKCRKNLQESFFVRVSVYQKAIKIPLQMKIFDTHKSI